MFSGHTHLGAGTQPEYRILLNNGKRIPDIVTGAALKGVYTSIIIDTDNKNLKVTRYNANDKDREVWSKTYTY